MATFRPTPPPPPISISTWRGVNEAVGLTGLALGETLRQVDFRITSDGKLEEREGHNTLINYANIKDVQGMWEGYIGGKHVLISCNDGKVYEYNFATLTNTQIGTMTDAKTSMLYFESKLLFFNGTDYKEYSGTVFQNVVPYVPTLRIATPPAGGGTFNQVVNLLTGRKKQEFQGDGIATVFQLAELNIDADLVTCKIDGAIKVEGTDFTVNRVTGKVTFTVIPPSGSLVIPEWTKVDITHADFIKKNRFAMTFGPDNDTSIFLWGNTAQGNRRSWCASLNYGYWPMINYTYVGTNEYAITDIKAQNANYQIIFKEDRTHYSTATQVTLPNGTVKYDYFVYDLNEAVGNVPFNGVQLIGDNAVSADNNSWWKWQIGAVESHRSADVISQRLQQSLSLANLSLAITFNYKAKKEYWCNINEVVYIWNYGNNTMYTFENIAGTCFLEINGTVFYGSKGTIEKMEGLEDNGVEVIPQADTGFYPFGGINLLKSSDMIYVGLLPDIKTSLTVSFKTNKITDWKQIRRTARYSLLDFNNYDFNNYTFLTNRNPQTFALEFSSNDYTYIQFRLENIEVNETCTVLDFLVQAEIQGEV